VTALTEPKIDGHCHVLDPENYPYRADVKYRPAGQEIGTEGQFRAVGEAYNVRHALLVGPNSGYGEDNSYLLDVIARGGGRYKGVAVVDNDASPERLAELKAKGIVGIAVNATYHGVDYYRDIGPLIRRLEALDMFLQVQVEGEQLLELLPLIEHSDVKLLVDHCGRPRADLGLDRPGFAALLALGRAGRGVIKLSGVQKISLGRYPYEDAWPFVHALADSFGLQRCMWGSDWPFLRAPERLDYGPLLTLIERLFPEPAARRQVFWRTSARLFGFAEAI